MTEQTSESTPNKPIRLADRDELVDLLQSRSPVLIEFYTKGCTLCQSIEPVLGNVARATGITVGMINPQFDLDLVEEHNIKSVPTLIVFDDGAEVGRLAEGFQGTDAVVDFISDHTDGVDTSTES
ncbi:thioredoxin [Halohasta litchfieldiae]|jgi:thiol-disulfide isomerase/thioredoxin|uniref:Thioredoxin n=1 Tax=Halohasta litchfieldiae TaxID=1073996 RepID=A0A1H6UWL5_9EURY|nr:thioredoxin family protein [Halohasta litchfieldiae]ATW87547.1 thioredoxin [Halohasta litchfieldiae]SEI96631.1 thioredoxin [Halohasta litchfieldiae]